MAIAKWQADKLKDALARLKKGPASLEEPGNEIMAQNYKIWVETWVISQLEDVLEDSKLNPIYRKV